MTADKPAAGRERPVAKLVRVRYENGAFTPLEPLDLEEGAVVELTVIKGPPTESSPSEPDSEDQ